MGKRSLHFDSADWFKIEARWEISIEHYYQSSINGHEISPPDLNQAYAVYGVVEILGRVLLLVVSRQKTIRYADEVIESCLIDLNPRLAEDLKRDVEILFKILTFSSCEAVNNHEHPKRALT